MRSLLLLSLCSVLLYCNPIYGQPINGIESLIAYETMNLASASASMSKAEWVKKKDVTDKANQVDYTMWGKKNSNNQRSSEVLMVGFKPGQPNIVVYSSTDETFYKKTDREVYKYGFSLKSRDKYKDADMSIYGNKDQRLVIMFKSVVKEKLYYTQYTYIVCKENQLDKINMVQ